jgi:hypothetical protein
MPSSAMAEHGPGATFHSLEVPQQGVGLDTLLRPPQEMECNNTSPKSIEDYMRKSAQFGYGRTGPSATFHSLEVPQQGVGPDG